MNKLRRRIEAAISLLEEAQAILEAVKDEEQEAFDNLPESLQGSERGEAMEEAAGTLDEIYGEIGDMMDTLSEI